MAVATRIGAARMKTLTIWGSTGSIGTNTLDVVRHSRHLYQVYALAAGRNVDALAAPLLEFGPNGAGAGQKRRGPGGQTPGVPAQGPGGRVPRRSGASHRVPERYQSASQRVA